MKVLRPVSNYSSRTIAADQLMLFVDCNRMKIRLIITRVSEVIMFSPCVFVTLFVCLCLYHDLTMKDWCHTNNILQVHYWGCLVVQVMFHAPMTSSMTSPGHKVGQILKVIYLRMMISCSTLYCIVLYCIILYCIVLYSDD